MKSLFLFMVKNGGFITVPKIATEGLVRFIAGIGFFTVTRDLIEKMIQENYLTEMETSPSEEPLIYIPNCNHPNYPDTTFMWRQMYELIEEKLGMKRVVK